MSGNTAPELLADASLGNSVLGAGAMREDPELLADASPGNSLLGLFDSGRSLSTAFGGGFQCLFL